MSKLSIIAIVAASLGGAVMAAPITEPLLLCQAPAWSADTQGVVAWVEAGEVVVAASRERDELPAYIVAGRQPPTPSMRLLRLPQGGETGVVWEGDVAWLHLSPTLSLACAPTREE